MVRVSHAGLALGWVCAVACTQLRVAALHAHLLAASPCPLCPFPPVAAAANDKPEPSGTAVSATIQEDTTAVFSKATLVAGAADIDAGDTLAFGALVEGPVPANGGVKIDGNNIIYTPAKDFNGADSFKYTVVDGAGESVELTANVTVSERRRLSGMHACTRPRAAAAWCVCRTPG